MASGQNVLAGAPLSVKFGTYTTSKGSPTMTDVGYTMDGVTFDPKVEFLDIMVDQKLGAVARIPKLRDLEVKVKLGEVLLDNLRIALGQPSSNLTGTSPNQTLFFDGSAIEQYIQAQFVVRGLGTNSSTTITLWKCVVKDPGSWNFKKDAAQGFDLTLGVCEETTGTGTDSFCRIVAA